MLKIDIETVETEAKLSKKGSYYHLQTAYAHVVDRDGKPKRYPSEMQIMCPTDASDNPIPYQPGTYDLGPQCFRVNSYGSLELGYVTLVPSKENKMKAVG
ncbi:G5P family DNA-binding protein [Porticoccaceae bacterium]|nr:G5P family DNA-binding protein [Porticoccaceae bacterium]